MLELAREVAVEVRGPDTARALLPPGRGRGSSVSSIVCYLTGLSHVDPIANELFLGRFLNEEITALPGHRPRLPARRARAADPAHARALRRASARRSSPPSRPTARAARSASWARRSGCRRGRSSASRAARRAGRPATSASDIVTALGAERLERDGQAGRWRHLAALAGEAHGLPRHLSQHSGGMIVATRPLVDCCPVVPAAMEGRQIVQWDKDSCADAGFLKIDLLGLGMLSAVERCVEQIAARARRADRPLADPLRRPARSTRRSSEAETTGVFQIESRAQMAARCCARGRRTSTTSRSRSRSCGPARSRAARSTPTSSAASACARTRPTRCPTSTRRSSRCCATRSARSSSRTR